MRADLFATGVVLYELLSRARPWGDPSLRHEMRAVAEGRIQPLDEKRPRIDRALLSIVHRLLAVDLALRFPTPDDALRALANRPDDTRGLGSPDMEVFGASAFGSHSDDIQRTAERGPHIVIVHPGGHNRYESMPGWNFRDVDQFGPEGGGRRTVTVSADYRSEHLPRHHAERGKLAYFIDFRGPVVHR